MLRELKYIYKDFPLDMPAMLASMVAHCFKGEQYFEVLNSLFRNQKKWIVESKSLKLYTQSYRNVGIFHEDAIVTIGKAIKNKLSPKWLRIEGYFYPRGGIPIDIFWQTGRLPKSVAVPEKKIEVYKGR